MACWGNSEKWVIILIKKTEEKKKHFREELQLLEGLSALPGFLLSSEHSPLVLWNISLKN